MPVYYGKTADGSDAKVFEGVHLSSCGNYWGVEPITDKQVRFFKRMEWKRKVSRLTNKTPSRQ